MAALSEILAVGIPCSAQVQLNVVAGEPALADAEDTINEDVLVVGCKLPEIEQKRAHHFFARLLRLDLHAVRVKADMGTEPDGTLREAVLAHLINAADEELQPLAIIALALASRGYVSPSHYVPTSQVGNQMLIQANSARSCKRALVCSVASASAGVIMSQFRSYNRGRRAARGTVLRAMASY